MIITRFKIKINYSMIHYLHFNLIRDDLSSLLCLNSLDLRHQELPEIVDID